MLIDGHEYLALSSVPDFLGVTKGAVYAYIARGRFTAVYVPGSRREKAIALDDLQAHKAEVHNTRLAKRMGDDTVTTNSGSVPDNKRRGVTRLIGDDAMRQNPLQWYESHSKAIVEKATASNGSIAQYALDGARAMALEAERSRVISEAYHILVDAGVTPREAMMAVLSGGNAAVDSMRDGDDPKTVVNKLLNEGRIGIGEADAALRMFNDMESANLAKAEAFQGEFTEVAP